MDKSFVLNIPISKVDEEQRMVWGIATGENVDVQGDIVDYEASKIAFKNWVGNIREMHGPVAVGKAIDIQYDDDAKQVIIGTKISESADGENAWIKVKEGILQGFSIGGSVHKTQVEKVDGKNINRITEYELAETSLVDNPANPLARFIMVKNFAGELRHVEVAERVTTPFPVAWWHKYFMARPMVSTQSEYNQTEKSKGVTMKKSIYGADFLIDLACQLNYWIESEKMDGEDVSDLVTALTTIKQAAIGELNEPADAEDEAQDLNAAVELANKTINLKKGNDMSKETITKAGAFVEGEEPKDANAQVVTKVTASPNAKKVGAQAPAPVKKSTAVVGGEERDENAEVLATQEETGRPVNDTPERADEAGVPVVGTIVENEDGSKSVQPVVHAEGTAAADVDLEAQVVEAPAEEVVEGDKEVGAEPDGEGKSSDEEVKVEVKASTISDLVKSVEGLEKKISGDANDELTKVSGSIEKVADLVKGLEARIEALEGQPAATKTKASYVVAKEGDVETAIDAEVQTVLKRADELAKSPQLAKHVGEPMEIAMQLRKFAAEGRLK